MALDEKYALKRAFIALARTTPAFYRLTQTLHSYALRLLFKAMHRGTMWSAPRCHGTLRLIKDKELVHIFDMSPLAKYLKKEDGYAEVYDQD